MIYPEFPECDIEYGMEQNIEKMIAWVEDMIDIARDRTDLKSRIAHIIFEEVHLAGYCEGKAAEELSRENTLL